jgi:ABC-2 type transport system ATP-binding protein
MLYLEDIRKSFGQIRAVDGLSLELRRGEIFGLLGPNGAGKTTTVNLAVGVLRPEAGRIEIEGESPLAAKARRRMGVAPQALALYDDLTGEENLTFFGRLQGLAGARLSDKVQWALDFVQLSERRKDRVKTYSGGMKRRLNLAVAVTHEPDLLLLDEPTAGVDPQSRNALFDNILSLRKMGRTILYTTHYMEEAQRLCDRVGIMDQGRLLALDTVDNLIAAHGGSEVVVAQWDWGEERIETQDPIEELAKLRVRGRLLRFRVERPNLESVFLTLTGKHLRD